MWAARAGMRGAPWPRGSSQPRPGHMCTQSQQGTCGRGRCKHAGGVSPRWSAACGVPGDGCPRPAHPVLGGPGSAHCHGGSPRQRSWKAPQLRESRRVAAHRWATRRTRLTEVLRNTSGVTHGVEEGETHGVEEGVTHGVEEGVRRRRSAPGTGLAGRAILSNF